jgi:hypothetical protein
MTNFAGRYHRIDNESQFQKKALVEAEPIEP